MWGKHMRLADKQINTQFLGTLSGLAIIMVVLIHLRVFTYAHVYFGGENQFIEFTQLSTLDKIIEQLIRFAVPIFVFISGFKFAYNYQRHLVDGRYRWKAFFLSRLKKLAVPYVIWSAFYLLAGYLLETIQALLGIGTATQFFTREQLIGLLTGFGNYAYQLWFLPLLLIVSFTVIFFRYILRAPWVLYVFYIVFYVGLFFFPDIVEKAGAFGIWPRYFLNFELGLLFGAQLSQQGRLPRLWPLVAGWLLIAAARLFNQSLRLDAVMDTLLMILTPLAAYYLVGTLARPRPGGVFTILGEESWAIYLLHAPILTNMVNSISEKLGLVAPWLDLPKAAIILLISLLVARLLCAKLPRLSRLLLD